MIFASVIAPSTSRCDDSRREVRGRGARRPLADKDAQPNGARAGLLQRLDLPEAHQRGELIALVDDGLGIGGSGFEGLGENIGGKLFQIGTGDEQVLDW